MTRPAIRSEALAWPWATLGRATSALADRAGFVALDPSSGRPVEEGLGPAAPPVLETPPASRSEAHERVVAAALRNGVEAERITPRPPDLEGLLASGAPVLLRIPHTEAVLAVLPGRNPRVVTPGGEAVRCPLSDLSELLRERIGVEERGDVDRLLATTGFRGDERERARRALLDERTATEPCTDGWILHPHPARSLPEQIRADGAIPHVARLLGAHAAGWSLLFTAWGVLGASVLRGRLDPGWLWAWALLLATLIPFQALELWSRGALSLSLGTVLRRRLLRGSLRLDPEELRARGAGDLLGRISEAERVEDLALSGGFLVLLAGVEFSLAAVVLALGASGRILLVCLVTWTAVLGALIWRLFLERDAWARVRVAMTSRLVERLLGYRTRLVQEAGENWHTEEDRELEKYLGRSEHLDRWSARFEAVASRGWLLLSIAALAPGVAFGATSAAEIALALGGILLAARAFAGVSGGMLGLTGAVIAWRQVAPLLRAANRPPLVGMSGVIEASSESSPPGRPILLARGLDFRYPDRSRPALEACDLELAPGDRVLLTGASGSGKSTLISLLAALRRPDSGLILLHGADLHGWGSLGWHRRVVATPQFQDNHLLAAPLAFNLLLGRAWPPSPEDLAEARTVCLELGLGELLDRMPAGLLQPVGETGWELSHGEKSRVYLARSLLQGAEVVLVDESFAALDPENVDRALECAARRAPTLLVAAHP